MLSDREGRVRGPSGLQVSMHLLVLSAFRLGDTARVKVSSQVSMHLLVLSAFRLEKIIWPPPRR